ncbi:Peptidogalycan biosysnthesis/recognition [Trema orientale]|uniref:Peptidogalycan biosysnthesis/recognition n=1 Tax=Trema orientale TaxID=63057 RepID=A0A2P5CWP8_TREOI|nr:Peptidogalycan biosysnthesis/recognition [Trema orientale]
MLSSAFASTITLDRKTEGRKPRSGGLGWAAMEVATSCCKPSPFLPKFQTHFRSGRSQFREVIGSSVQGARVTALFWVPKTVAEPRQLDFSLGNYALAGSSPEGVSGDEKKPKVISISVLSSISEVSSGDWDACTRDATGPEKFNPFLTHGFLSSLEESGSAVKETGWMPRHIIAKDETENILGVVPLYLKSHSYGEFVFDHSWADAYYSFGSRYYPKLQCCVPFTPVTGPRILVRNTSFRDQVFEIMISALKDLTVKSQLSSLHITFPSKNDWRKLSEKGFLQRIGMQYHWKNLNYKR